jgi:hypothetical protein
MTEQATVTRNSHLSVYYAPEWSSRVARVAAVSRATDGAYAVDLTPVREIRTIGLFSVLTCVDDTSHAVLTAYLRLIGRAPDEAREQP